MIYLVKKIEKRPNWYFLVDTISGTHNEMQSPGEALENSTPAVTLRMKCNIPKSVYLTSHRYTNITTAARMENWLTSSKKIFALQEINLTFLWKGPLL